MEGEFELTPRQKEVVNYRPEGDLLVKGIPGSGKTLTIVQRAALLSRMDGLWTSDPEVARVRVFTYNKMLLEWISFLSGRLGEEAPEMTTFHSWARATMKAMGVRYTPAFDDDGAELLGAIESGKELPAKSVAHHVLIDEGQDLTPEALQVLKKSALTSFTIAADKAQNIYPTGFTWKSLGIKVQGRSKSLNPSFRGSKQIALLAADIVRHDPAVDSEEWIKQEDGLGDGPVPEIYLYGSWPARDAVISQVISEAKSANRRATIALLHPRARPVWGIARQFGARILDNDTPDMVSPGVLASTIHRAKGLEFDTVVLEDANEGLLPPSESENGSSEKELEETFRRLFYVAVTRARRRLVIMCDRTKPSQFIKELDPQHFVMREC
ncbi:MAG TPA: 3'-5' exonuclease [Candidatus Limnocylindria bacterium]|nr:3'-5' exonuclease [Candidatus Limnocylindria bacterium]